MPQFIEHTTGKRRSQPGYGRDAGINGGMAFLNSALELVRPKLIMPFSSTTWARDIVTTFGGGLVDYMSAYTADFGTTGGNQYGLSGTNTTDIALIQADIKKGLWKAFLWQINSRISDIDLEKLRVANASGQAPPFSYEKLLRDGVALTWDKACAKVVYTGWIGYPGLLNNPSVLSTLSPATGTLNGVVAGSAASRLWINKTPQQIQSDFNAALLGTVKAGAYSMESMADTILLDWDVYNLLTQPYTLGGIGTADSVMEYIFRNNIARKNGIELKVFPVANDYISQAGAGGTSRMVAYRNDEDVVKLHIPAPLAPVMTMPTIQGGVFYETNWRGSIGQVQWYRTQPASYTDGIA